MEPSTIIPPHPLDFVEPGARTKLAFIGYHEDGSRIYRHVMLDGSKWRPSETDVNDAPADQS